MIPGSSRIEAPGPLLHVTRPLAAFPPRVLGDTLSPGEHSAFSTILSPGESCAQGENDYAAAGPKAHPGGEGDVPQSLPRFLVAHCGDPASWIYSDQKCDGTNNCGDCSDEQPRGLFFILRFTEPQTSELARTSEHSQAFDKRGHYFPEKKGTSPKMHCQWLHHFTFPPLEYESSSCSTSSPTFWRTSVEGARHVHIEN
ncbi:PREDICTED: low-density lipoprotein receptor class A domain-containing protein 1 [Cercocebus atys]|uniref:low-density lipoprotein receptor class A domain-containing protein 1 n=1 Tax=Cercocebus atys TaxID=9531 RepID=UPI0005F47333|nr:PREDICTED: low-density lipoprotein receptor class A domain-containing protein 1 [Cercocebus atys]